MTKYNLKSDGSITNSQVTLTSFMVGENLGKVNDDAKENDNKDTEECSACKSKFFLLRFYYSFSALRTF